MWRFRKRNNPFLIQWRISVEGSVQAVTQRLTKTLNTCRGAILDRPCFSMSLKWPSWALPSLSSNKLIFRTNGKILQGMNSQLKIDLQWVHRSSTISLATYLWWHHFNTHGNWKNFQDLQSFLTCVYHTQKRLHNGYNIWSMDIDLVWKCSHRRSLCVVTSPWEKGDFGIMSS